MNSATARNKGSKKEKGSSKEGGKELRKEERESAGGASEIEVGKQVSTAEPVSTPTPGGLLRSLRRIQPPKPTLAAPSVFFSVLIPVCASAPALTSHQTGVTRPARILFPFPFACFPHIGPGASIPPSVHPRASCRRPTLELRPREFLANGLDSRNREGIAAPVPMTRCGHPCPGVASGGKDPALTGRGVGARYGGTSREGTGGAGYVPPAGRVAHEKG